MGRGRSKVGGGGGQRANTPSGIDMQQFNAMTMDQKISTINTIIADPSIVVPAHVDDSETSKVLYALGMDNKPTVVDDATLDSMPGRELFRTVYESGFMPPPSSKEIADQVKFADYTQMSGSGGSVHGRALYFATSFGASAVYGTGWGQRKQLVMRGKLNPNANIQNESRFFSGQEWSDFRSKYNGNSRDAKAMFALSKGIDGWHDSFGYDMIINRGILTMSSTNKHISVSGRGKSSSSIARNWSAAKTLK